MEKPDFFSTLIPFSGFYYTIHGDVITTEEDRIFCYDNGEAMPALLNEKFFDSCDYKSVYNEYAKEYVSQLAEILDIKIEYEEMISPREYNFQTDRIFGKISRNDLAKMLWKIKGKQLNDRVKAKFTSRSGFISFYSNNIKDWGRIYTWDHNQIGVVLEIYCEEINEDYSDKIAENISSNDHISDWLFSHAGDWGQWAIRVADFFRTFRY